MKLEDGRGGYLIRCEACNHMIEVHLAPEVEMMKAKNAFGVRCPFCNSSDCKKISDLSKVASAAVFGVFSLGKVSKTWHCNSCGSNFG